MEAEAQAESDALVLPPAWSGLQQLSEVETSIHQPEWSQSAWNSSEPVLPKLQKGVKAEYSRSMSVPELVHYLT